LEPLATAYLCNIDPDKGAGDPEANGLIRGVAQHLLLSCDPLPAVAALEGEVRDWIRALDCRTGQPLLGR
jgi:hypothetical protein